MIIYAEESCSPSIGDFVLCDPNEAMVIVSLPNPASVTLTPGDTIRVGCAKDVADPLSLSVIRPTGSIEIPGGTQDTRLNGVPGQQFTVQPYTVVTCTWLGSFRGWAVR